MSTKIVLIHGANSSNVSWNWIGEKIENHLRLDWNMLDGPDRNLESLEERLPNEPCIVVGHSMGGLYAWHLANRNPDRILHGISLGTPWGGSFIQAVRWRMFNTNSDWLDMLDRFQPWTKEPRKIKPPVNWTNIVTTHGFDFFGMGPNDGVVTVDSQQELHQPHEEILLDYSHNQILQSDELVDIIKHQIKLNFSKSV